MLKAEVVLISSAGDELTQRATVFGQQLSSSETRFGSVMLGKAIKSGEAREYHIHLPGDFVLHGPLSVPAYVNQHDNIVLSELTLFFETTAPSDDPNMDLYWQGL